MSRKYLTWALVLLFAAIAPLTLVVFLVLRAGNPEDLGYLVWGTLSAACAGLLVIGFRALAAHLAQDDASAIEIRLERLSLVVFVLSFLSVLPLWYAVIDPVAGGAWETALFWLCSPMVIVIFFWFFGFRSYRSWYRLRFEEAGIQFDGSRWDQLLQRRAYVEDIKWLYGLVRRRLTSASS